MKMHYSLQNETNKFHDLKYKTLENEKIRFFFLSVSLKTKNTLALTIHSISAFIAQFEFNKKTQ